jgi:CubicO group peptidase (beta-lactamase class C family)
MNAKLTTNHQYAEFKTVDHLMRQAVSEKVFPGAVLLVSQKNAILFFEAYGYANIFSKAAMTRETIFDLASLTKPLATALAVMLLVQQGKIELEQDLGSLLPEFKDSDKSGIRLKQLLYHNAGFPDYRPYYQALSKVAPDKRQDALRKWLRDEPLVHPIGETVLYSDLGFMILRRVVEYACGCRLDQFVTDEIYRPLTLENLFFIPLDGKVPAVNYAATEKCPWRRKVLEGQVHDENAYVLGGIEGHAGLFGSAQNIHCLTADLLCSFHGYPSSRLFQQERVRTFFKRLPGTDKALGFDMPSLTASSSGRLFSKNSVGHLGFSGTSFWMDLEREIVVILLTNRIHPMRTNDRIKAFRPRLHDAVMQPLA